MSSELIINVTTANFEAEVINSEIPVLVDFWAEWCGPCKMLAPTLEALAPEMAGKVKIVKVDIDSERDLAVKYGVRGIPTMMVMKGGLTQATKVGVIPRKQIEDFIAGAI